MPLLLDRDGGGGGYRGRGGGRGGYDSRGGGGGMPLKMFLECCKKFS